MAGRVTQTVPFTSFYHMDSHMVVVLVYGYTLPGQTICTNFKLIIEIILKCRHL